MTDHIHITGTGGGIDAAVKRIARLEADLADARWSFERERRLNLEALFMLEALGGGEIEDDQWRQLRRQVQADAWALGYSAGAWGEISENPYAKGTAA